MLSIRSPSRSASGPLEYHSHTRRWSEAELKTRGLIRWRMAAVICCVLIVPRAYAAKFHPARGFALSRQPKRRYSTAAESFSRLLRSCARLRACANVHVCARACAYACTRVHWKSDTVRPAQSLSFRLFLSSRFTLAHVHTLAIASLFACTNCCILHAYEALSLSLFLSHFLSRLLAFIFSLDLSASFCLSPSRLSYISPLLADRFNIFVSCYPMQRRAVQDV